MENLIQTKSVSAIRKLKKNETILSYLHDSINVQQWNKRREQVKEAKGVDFISKVDSELQIRFAQFMPIGMNSNEAYVDRIRAAMLSQYGSMDKVISNMTKKDANDKFIYPRWLISEVTDISVDNLD